MKENGKIKILLLTGFLGSGKTTLLRRILAWEQDLTGTMVLVNELGKVGIDGALLKNGETDIVELNSGCICCSMKSDLLQTLLDIGTRFQPKRILMEATGVAKPKSVAEVIEDPALRGTMEIQKIITVLDVRFWTEREKFGSFFMDQIEQAHVVLLNKIDTVEKDRIAQSLAEMKEHIPDSMVIPTQFCEIDPEILWAELEKPRTLTDITPFYTSLHDIPGAQVHGHAGHDHGPDSHAHGEQAGFVTFSFVEQNPFDENKFQAFLEDAPWELFRIKGSVRFPGRTGLLNFVSGKPNWENWHGDPATRLAFVGWKVEEQQILNQIKQCVLPAA